MKIKLKKFQELQMANFKRGIKCTVDVHPAGFISFTTRDPDGTVSIIFDNTTTMQHLDQLIKEAKERNYHD